MLRETSPDLHYRRAPRLTPWRFSRRAANAVTSLQLALPWWLEGFVEIEKDRNRPFINQLDGHRGLKYSRRHADSKVCERSVKLFVQRRSFFLAQLPPGSLDAAARAHHRKE